MKPVLKIGIAQILSLSILGTGVAFAVTDKVPPLAGSLFDESGYISSGLPQLPPPSTTKPLNLISAYSLNEEKNQSVHPATFEKLYKAIELNDLEKAKKLLIGLDIDGQDKSGITPLYKSVFHNRTGLVHLLLKQGADANLTDHEGLSPLHVAALENLGKLVPMLLDRGANLEAKDNYGYTPLHLAVDQGSTRSASVLIERGANVYNRTDWNNTPLHASVASGNMKLVKLLLKEGAKIDAIDRLGRSVLHWVAEKGFLSIVCLSADFMHEVSRRNENI